MQTNFDLDDLDKRILSLLTEDGRISSAEIARILRVDKRKATYRLKRLLEKNAISIHGVLNYQLLGYQLMAAIYCRVELSRVDEVARELAKKPEVRYVQTTFGEYNLFFHLLLKSTQELKRFLTTEMPKFKGVLSAEADIVSEIHKEIHQWVPAEVEGRSRESTRSSKRRKV